MAVKLHRCDGQWIKVGGHPCWRVEKALIDQGIEYERVPGPGVLHRKKRTRLHELTGGWLYPAIEFEDGSVYREESKDMANRIRAGRLFESTATQASPPETEADPAGI
jgi:hypothetical protein